MTMRACAKIIHSRRPLHKFTLQFDRSTRSNSSHPNQPVRQPTNQPTMPAPVPTPHLLAPYTAPPPAGSLTLCTSVINATHTWLMLSMLRDALAAKEDDVATGGPPQKPRLVLVSFVKKWDFWRSEARKMVRVCCLNKADYSLVCLFIYLFIGHSICYRVLTCCN